MSDNRICGMNQLTISASDNNGLDIAAVMGFPEVVE